MVHREQEWVENASSSHDRSRHITLGDFTHSQNEDRISLLRDVPGRRWVSGIGSKDSLAHPSAAITHHPRNKREAEMASFVQMPSSELLTTLLTIDWNLDPQDEVKKTFNFSGLEAVYEDHISDRALFEALRGAIAATHSSESPIAPSDEITSSDSEGRILLHSRKSTDTPQNSPAHSNIFANMSGLGP
ncbi:hypothetical protein SCHPADRAFT_891928 [Schizopora paradoxa]|uniref:Uncharacterized protein n=1 Tax=Schizopora paradoxa TaxID=27342 RepID=A0A0H2RNI0_9AGAM|nr:hypothetical protein SCHPADRAFT_891928 [Schizopora paradoxa]